MRYTASRKYPITHMKKTAEAEQRYLDLSVTAAVGILALVFAGGLLGGCLIKKWMD